MILAILCHPVATTHFHHECAKVSRDFEVTRDRMYPGCVCLDNDFFRVTRSFVSWESRVPTIFSLLGHVRYRSKIY